MQKFDFIPFWKDSFSNKQFALNTVVIQIPSVTRLNWIFQTNANVLFFDDFDSKENKSIRFDFEIFVLYDQKEEKGYCKLTSQCFFWERLMFVFTVFLLYSILYTKHSLISQNDFLFHNLRNLCLIQANFTKAILSFIFSAALNCLLDN